MAIECYHDDCPCHASHNCKDAEECEGPYCYEETCIINKYPKLISAMRCAAICGLQHVTEAVTNMDRSMDMFMPYSKIPAELTALYGELVEWEKCELGDDIPKFIIEEENKKLDEYFHQMVEREKYHQDKDCWVSEGEEFVNIHTGARMPEDEFYDYWNEDKKDVDLSP